MIEIRKFYSSEIAKYLDEIGNMRIQVFKEWPYLYKGSLEYERKYLKTYSENQQSLCLLVFDRANLVGISTATALENEDDAVKHPLKNLGYSVSEICYFGETCILPEYRGRGLYKSIFFEREQFAKEIQKSFACFCAVIRDLNHPLKPKTYLDLAPIWQSYGYKNLQGAVMNFKWQDIDENQESQKSLSIWIKQLK